MQRITGGKPYTLDRSMVFEVKADNGEAYRVMVAWPEVPPPPGGWPALYVLDGEDYFGVVAPALRQLTNAEAETNIAPSLVIGIEAGPSPRRTYDYTPALTGFKIPSDEPRAGLSIGGAGAFLDLIEKRIMPQVRQRWHVDTERETIIGHGFGGLVALHAYLNRPNLFDAHVSVSPSLWFDTMESFTKATHSALRGRSSGKLLLAVGGEDYRPDGHTAPEVAQLLLKQIETSRSPSDISFVELSGQSEDNSMLAVLSHAIHFAAGRPTLQ